MDKRKIKQLTLLISLVFVFVVLLYKTRTIPYEDRIREILTEYGLEKTQIKYYKNDYEDHYVFVHRDKDSVTYHQLFCLMNDIDNISSFIEVDKFVSGKDSYTINQEAGVVFLNGAIVYTDYEYLAEQKRKAEEKAKADEEYLNRYRDRYPFVGMSEYFIENTVLGEPDSKEYCRDFNKLQTRAQYVTYTWNNSKYGKYEVVVCYRKHRSHRVDDYVDLSAGNGYVDRIYYWEDGDLITLRYTDTLPD